MAVVEREKITDYLLDPAHPDNGGKAPFFQSLGCGREDWTTLSAAFRKLVETTEVTKRLESPHGRKYILDGRIESPSDVIGADDLDYQPWTGHAATGYGVSPRGMRASHD